MITFDLVRDHMRPLPVTGQVYCPPDLSMFTLELPWLDNEVGISCIPLGTYQCIMSMSARFGRMMPQLINVPERTGIRIHGGNTYADTEGCILLGMSSANGVLGHSQKAISYFTPWLREALSREDVYCDISEVSAHE